MGQVSAGIRAMWVRAAGLRAGLDAEESWSRTTRGQEDWTSRIPPGLCGGAGHGGSVGERKAW